ncbi:ECF transporter S component [bacterium]|nr:ECF transporter S component [bacterium]
MRKIAYGGILIALAVGFGYLLAPVPNLELVSIILSFSGFLLGISWGVVVGGIGFFLYSALNPLGIAPPLTLIAQVMGGMLFGLAGGLYAKIYSSKRSLAVNMVVAGLFGVVFTLLFDVLTNLGGYIAGASKETLAIFMVGGLSFLIFHTVSNTVIFAVLFPVLAKLVPVLRKKKEVGRKEAFTSM